MVLGYVFIRQGKRIAHQRSMLSAFGFSTLFMINYVIYHATHESTKYQGAGSIRYVYFFILITHIILAAAVVPFVLRTLWLAFQEELLKHKKLARYTLGI